MSAPPYGPANALESARFQGITTFARVPHLRTTEGVGVAIVGAPFDTGTSFRAGARFGPRGIRDASALLRPWHAGLHVDVFAQSVIDWGDIDIVPGNAVRSMEKLAAGLESLVRAGVTPIVLGGDHTILLGELRAHAAVHGPVGVVIFDAHADLWDSYYGERVFHGTVLLRAVEEGLVDPARSLIAGVRGPLYGPEDERLATDLGFTVLDRPGPELAKLVHEERQAGLDALGARLVMIRRAGTGT